MPPFRLAYRGLGETQPIAVGDSEEARAKNRRVVFHLVRLQRPDGAAEPAGDVILPWNGRTVPRAKPVAPEPAPAAPETSPWQ